MTARSALIGVAFAVMLSGCAHDSSHGVGMPMLSGIFASHDADPSDAIVEAAIANHSAATVQASHATSWGEPHTRHKGFPSPKAVADTDGPYLLDTGDRLRVFVYGQPNLSRLYIVDHDGRITVPLIGAVNARGATTRALEGTIRARLGSQFVKDPQVTVDVQQNRPFFILGEVRSAGQFPYVSGMTVETAVAIAGGYSERANERKARITRRMNGLVEVMEVPADYVVQPGDTVYVYERIF